jgi:ribosomal protein S18 acetylase RimI-like enzyme
MQARSLGFRTDLIFHRFSGEVGDRGDHLLIRTPSNPTFRWGNFLLYERAPEPGDVERWEAAFAAEVGEPPETTHKVFAWDSPAGERGSVDEFIAAGYRLDESVVLSARPDDIVRPPKYDDEVVVRSLSGDEDFRQAIDLSVANRDEWEDEAGFREYVTHKFEERRAMTAAGLGTWFGAFLGDRMVAECGLYSDGELARYQAVDTHPDYRRRGICSTMVHQVAEYGIQQMGARQLVMVADENYFAKDIYASVGFKRTEKRLGIEKYRGMPGS